MRISFEAPSMRRKLLFEVQTTAHKRIHNMLLQALRKKLMMFLDLYCPKATNIIPCLSRIYNKVDYALCNKVYITIEQSILLLRWHEITTSHTAF